MILVSRETERGRNLRLRLNRMGVPCAFWDAGDYFRPVRDPSVTVIFREEWERDNRTECMGITDKVLVGFAEESTIHPDAYFYNGDRDGDLCEFLTNRLLRLYSKSKVTPEFPLLKTEDGEYLFAGEKLPLTLREKLIVNFFSFSLNKSRSCEQLARYCLKGGVGDRELKTAVVYISGINRKSREYCSRKLILTERYTGYRLNPVCLGAEGIGKHKENTHRKRRVKPKYV